MGMSDVDTVDTAGIHMVAFVLEFILHHQDDEQRAGYANRKPGDVDKSVYLLPAQIAESDLQIVFKHDKTPSDRVAENEGDPIKKLDPVPAAGSCSSLFFQDAVIYFIEVPADENIFRFREETIKDPAGHAGRPVKRVSHIPLLFL